VGRFANTDVLIMKDTGFLLEFIPMKIGAGMTTIDR